MNDGKAYDADEVRIFISHSCSEKERALEICDDGFTISVVNRSDYRNLLSKIDKNAVFLIAKIGEKIVGYAAFYTNNRVEKVAYLTLIGVEKNYQGKKIGTKLMKKAIMIAKDNDMNIMKLEVLDTDKGAQNFYKKMGFQIKQRCSEKSLYMECNI